MAQQMLIKEMRDVTDVCIYTCIKIGRVQNGVHATLAGNFLPVQLNNAGKTNCCRPDYHSTQPGTLLTFPTTGRLNKRPCLPALAN